MAKKTEMEVVRLHRFDEEDSKLKAFVDVAIGGFIVKGLRLVEGQKGLFLGMPQEQGKDGRWYSSFYPKDADALEALTAVVLAAYQNEAETCEA